MKDRAWNAPALRGLALLTAGILAAPVIAQEGAVLEEVLVTAERRETLLQETPVAVSVLDEGKIQDIGLFDIADVGSLAPNTIVQMQPGSNSNSAITVRGVGSGETSLMLDPKVGLYIDGMYMSKTVGALFDIIDIESVEVLRGPQGTLFGRNSTGGALNISTAKPSGEWGSRLLAGAGSDGYRRYAGAIDLPKLGDFLSARFSGMLMRYDGWADNDHPGQESDLASEDNGSYRVALRFTPVEQLTLDYAYDRTDNEGVPAPFQVTAVRSMLDYGAAQIPFPFVQLGGPLYQQMAASVGDPRKRREEYRLDHISTEKLDVEGHGLTAVWTFPAVTLKYIFSDRETNSTYARTDLDGGAHSAPDLLYGGGMAVPTPGFHASIPEGWVDMTTHELQLFGSLAEERLFFTLGYYNYREEVYQDNPQTFGLPIAFIAQRNPLLAASYARAGFCNQVPGVGPVCIGSQRLPLPLPFPGADPNGNGFVDFIYGQDSDSWAAYGQLVFGLTDRLDLSVGLRYTEDEKTGFLFNENLLHLSFADRLINERDWDNLSYRFNLNYEASEDANLYFTYSTGYNAGGFNARALTATAFSHPVEEEKISALELGLKAEWWDRRLRTNFDLFLNEFKDLQIAQFEAGSGGASSRLVNAGEATYWGIELDAAAILAEGLTADLSYGYLDASFDEYLARNPLTDQEMDIADATTMPAAPKHTANIGLQYDFAPFAAGSVSLRFDATYTGEFTFHPFLNQHDRTYAHWLLNGRISINDLAVGEYGRMRLSFWVKNLTDKHYREWGIDFADLGFAGAVHGRPRTFGIDLVWEMRGG